MYRKFLIYYIYTINDYYRIPLIIESKLVNINIYNIDNLIELLLGPNISRVAYRVSESGRVKRPG